MRPSEIIRLATLYVVRRWQRTLLTVIGVVIGTACIVLMFSIGLTNANGIDTMMGDESLTVIEVNPRQLVNSRELNASAIEALEQIEHVQESCRLGISMSMPRRGVTLRN